MAQFGVGAIVQPAQPPLFLSSEKQQQGFLDWLLKGLDKESFPETDPVLNKVEGSSSNGAASAAKQAPKKGAKAAAPADQKKGGLLGGLFGNK